MLCLLQLLRSVSGSQAHVKWADLLDKLTIAGHSHQAAAELYTEITDHVPLLTDVSYYWLCSMYMCATDNAILNTELNT